MIFFSTPYQHPVAMYENLSKVDCSGKRLMVWWKI
jgi:hypothetical protein